jgi:hypothetical protein
MFKASSGFDALESRKKSDVAGRKVVCFAVRNL